MQVTNWPDPSGEMIKTAAFDKVWQKIKTWDIAVPEAYSGRCGATGNHVRAILDALYDELHKPNHCRTCDKIVGNDLRACADVFAAALDEHAIKAMVDEQAADDGLWFLAHTAPEAYLQQELRRLHAVVEGRTPDQCAKALLG